LKIGALLDTKSKFEKENQGGKLYPIEKIIRNIWIYKKIVYIFVKKYIDYEI